MQQGEPGVTRDDVLNHISERVDEIHYSVFGNGTPGIKTRLDRLEQDWERRVWRGRAITTALIGAFVIQSVAGTVAIVKLTARHVDAPQTQTK